MVSSVKSADRSRSRPADWRFAEDRPRGSAIGEGIGGAGGSAHGQAMAAGASARGTLGPARQDDVLAALDLGTNNCRLLVAKPLKTGGFRVIDAFSRIVRLGEGVGVSGSLSEAAIDRTLDALRVCGSKLRRRRVTRFRAVATEACRRARNGTDFLRRVQQDVGIALEIITASEEASLAMAGCAPLLDPDVPGALVFDIGGGSTELAWSRRGASDAVVASIPIGVVTLAESYGGDRYGPGVYERMVGDVTRHLRAYEEQNGIGRELAAGRVQIIGTSGTVTTLAGVHLGLPRYIRDRVDGVFLNVADTLAIGRDLAGQSFEERARHPCIGRDRADLVVAGCAILEAICRQWPVSRMRVADRGVREGILFGLITGTR